MRIDAHQHYWDTNAFDYGWARAGLPALERPFLPAELGPQLARAGIDRTVVVQVLHTLDETWWLLDLARSTPSIAGVVGWIDLQAPADEVETNLEALRREPNLVGIRHLVHEERDDEWLARQRSSTASACSSATTSRTTCCSGQDTFITSRTYPSGCPG
jgi:L-fuconolactonase